MSAASQFPILKTDYLSITFIDTVGDGTQPPGLDIIRLWVGQPQIQGGIAASIDLFPWHARELATMLVQVAEKVEAASHGQEGSA